jgi:hypothetical protein
MARTFCSAICITLLCVNSAAASCNKGTIEGIWGAQGNLTFRAADGSFGSPTFLLARFNFNGSGKVSLSNGKVSVDGAFGNLTGNGTYTLAANCVGTMSINPRINGSPASKMRLDFLVTGDSSNPSIRAVYTNRNGIQESGQLQLEPIKL